MKAPINDVSDTALWVAAFRADETERPDALYKDPLAAVLTGERGRQIAREMPFRQITAWVMAVRTVALDGLIKDAIDRGADTIVNIGAGLDTRPYRLDLPKTLKWVEVDFPHMIKLKSEKLANEKPRCELERVGLDFSNRAEALRIYAELGARTKCAAIITEGVIPYLTIEQGGQLADDLRGVSSFRYWILDYHKHQKAWRIPSRLRRKLKNAPFQFEHPDPVAFFVEHGWSVYKKIYAIDEGERLGRKFPVPFPWSLLTRFLPKKLQGRFRKANGYAMLQRPF